MFGDRFLRPPVDSTDFRDLNIKRPSKKLKVEIFKFDNEYTKRHNKVYISLKFKYEKCLKTLKIIIYIFFIIFKINI